MSDNLRERSDKPENFCVNCERLKQEIANHKRHIQTLKKKIRFKKAAYQRLKAEAL